MIAGQIGAYQILAKLGEGGMGEVYRARDTKLGREVAVKILPGAFAFDAERRARFAREARTLASLNHPHIAQIYGVEEAVAPPRADEESRETFALIMELVEGEDLATRIRRGPIPCNDAIAMARQIGDALGAAHEQGIVHRDLKPANIKLRDDGTIKVLDFGLAKALEPAMADDDARPGSVTNSPTITSPAGVTLRGVILGTAAYMSPEQAKGRLVDKRSDIWAFGCVLYEMVTGRRAFAGDDVSDTLASVLKSDVEWSGVPSSLVRLLKKCLEKDPRHRLHDIRDAWDLIDERAPAVERASAKVHWIAWGLAGLFLVSSMVLAVPYFTAAPAPSAVRFQLAPPPNTEFGPNVVVSPDGRHLAFTALDERRVTHLWVRDLASLEARRLTGTEGTRTIFWSPDSEHLAFATGTTLRRIAATGGPTQTIATVAGSSGSGHWIQDGVILFGSRGGDGLRRVSAGGGSPEPVTTLDPERGELAHAFPWFLPDGRHFVYFRQSTKPRLSGIYVGSLDTPPDQQDKRLLTPTENGPYFVINANGGARLLFVRQRTLLDQAFDTSRLELSGEPVALAEGLGMNGSAAFVSATETVLVTRTGAALFPNVFQPTWIDRSGKTLAAIGEPNRFAVNRFGLSLAPDGRTAAVTMTLQTTETDLWLLELARGIRTRFTFLDTPDSNPVWSPDGTRLAYTSSRRIFGDIYVKSVRGTADEIALTNTQTAEVPWDWSRDGRFLLFSRRRENQGDLWTMRLTEPMQETPLLETSFVEQGARFSPDARWIAYESDESGAVEVYVRPFQAPADGKPSVGPAWRVSTNGGEQIRWRDGKELFYRDPSGAIMSVDVITQGDTVQTGAPKRVFTPVAGVPSWDVTADGQRFLLLIPITQAMPDPITVALNWRQPK